MDNDLPSKADIERALRNTAYDGENTTSGAFPKMPAVPHDSVDLLNAARAIEMERALIKMLLINFQDDKSIAHAYQNARDVMKKWGQL